MQLIKNTADIDLHMRASTVRVLVACCLVSAALHGGLLLINGQPRGGPAHIDDESLELRVALAPSNRGEVVDQTSRNPLPFLRKTDSARLYPHLLSFTPVALPSPIFEKRDYLPLSKLTAPPTAARPVEIAYPDDTPRTELLVASLTLFINEDGSVAEVRAGSPHAPKTYEQAAVEAFSKARFNPGKVGKEPVKVRMVIRVAFDGGADAASRSSSGIKFK